MEGNIYKQVSQVMSEIEAVAKDQENKIQGYRFRGIDSIANELKPRLAKAGVFFCPEILSQERSTHQTKSGSTMFTTILTVKFTFYANDGSNISCSTVGESSDAGDKSSNKAMSAAWKYAMIQVFCIPTSDPKDSEFDDEDKRNKHTKQARPAMQSGTTPGVKTEIETLRLNYFASLKDAGIVDDNARHEWQLKFIGKDSTKDFTEQDYKDALTLLDTTNLPKENSPIQEKLNECKTKAELSQWWTDSIDELNKLPNKNKQSIMDAYRNKMKDYK